jgi:acetylornithine deacetylase/succinyl-diaminopimelate desuccinylase family protein
MDPYEGIIIGDRMYGRGTADTKGGLAALIMATRAIKKSGLTLKGDIILAAVVEEEISQLGTKTLVQKGLKADYAIVAEPTALDICVTHKGSNLIRIRANGKAAHGSRPDLGVNAIEQMMEIVGALKSLAERLKAVRHPILGSATLNIGTIEGGTGTNIVPAQCTITVDRRWVPGEKGEEVTREIVEMVRSVKERVPGLDAEIETFVSIPPMEIPQGSPIIRALQNAAIGTLGREPKLIGKYGTTDASILSSEGSIPTVVFGPGNADLAHKPNEYVSLTEVRQAAAVIANAVVDVLGCEKQ